MTVAVRMPSSFDPHRPLRSTHRAVDEKTSTGKRIGQETGAFSSSWSRRHERGLSSASGRAGLAHPDNTCTTASAQGSRTGPPRSAPMGERQTAADGERADHVRTRDPPPNPRIRPDETPRLPDSCFLRSCTDTAAFVVPRDFSFYVQSRIPMLESILTDWAHTFAFHPTPRLTPT